MRERINTFWDFSIGWYTHPIQNIHDHFWLFIGWEVFMFALLFFTVGPFLKRLRERVSIALDELDQD